MAGVPDPQPPMERQAYMLTSLEALEPEYTCGHVSSMQGASPRLQEDLVEFYVVSRLFGKDNYSTVL
jgi:hypothetical protein